jgi:hypothetical protein
VRKTLGDVDLDDAIKDVVWSRTHGIPLYCVEFARAVKDSGGAPLNELPGTCVCVCMYGCVRVYIYIYTRTYNTYVVTIYIYIYIYIVMYTRHTSLLC